LEVLLLITFYRFFRKTIAWGTELPVLYRGLFGGKTRIGDKERRNGEAISSLRIFFIRDASKRINDEMGQIGKVFAE